MRRNKTALELRKMRVDERAAYYAALTVQQKIDRLDKRLGKGIGAVKERAKLAKALATPVVAPKEKKTKQAK